MKQITCELENTMIGTKPVREAAVELIGPSARTVKLRFDDVVEVTLSNADVHELIRLLSMNVPIA